MELKLPKERAEKLGLKKLEAFGVNESSWNWKEMAHVDLRSLSPALLKKLRELLEANKEVHGVKMMLYDLGCYERATKDPSSVKVRNIRTFAPMLQEYLRPVTNHWVFSKLEGTEDSWAPYYVNEVKFHPRVEQRDGVIPAYVSLKLAWERFGGMEEKTYRWENAEVHDLRIPDILAKAELYTATPDLMQRYEAELKRYGEVVPRVGHQFLAVGTGTDDCDGNGRGEDRWYWRSSTLQFEREDGPSRVVIDVFRESDEKSSREDRVRINSEFWRLRLKVKDDDAKRRGNDEELEELEQEEADFEAGKIEYDAARIPVHPLCVVFDLRRHLRLRTHLNNLTKYVYDPWLNDKLILPKESKNLVEILIEHQAGGFVDIVKGKGGGAIVLLCGPPGTGKTLTAEVYAESEAKALYSVQASQLGTDPDTLEKELLKVLARAKRWSAVMLLDEADVYVHRRGNDLQQNAIVGVFLRVLEYHSSILFLTTNRPEDVDDAIASRCVARIDYGIPDVKDQGRIWRVLADAGQVKLSDATIAKITAGNPKLSGRDVKNLLKLACLISRSRRKDITPETIEFVRQFKPTCE